MVDVGANIRRLFMRRTGMFRSEPFILVGDVIRSETQTYEAVLKAVAAGRRTPQEIGDMLGLTSFYLSPYLKQLEALRLTNALSRFFGASWAAATICCPRQSHSACHWGWFAPDAADHRRGSVDTHHPGWGMDYPPTEGHGLSPDCRRLYPSGQRKETTMPFKGYICDITHEKISPAECHACAREALPPNVP